MKNGAENPGGIRFSYKKYYSFRNKINKKFSERFYSDFQIENVTSYLYYGDTQPAVVTNVNPLTVAAYSDEMDAVVMLRFPEEFVEKYSLSVGTHLTTSNVYSYEPIFNDIITGKEYSKLYADFIPVVQLFLGKNDKKIADNLNLFDTEKWEKVKKLAEQYTYDRPDSFRNGFFYFKKNH